MYDKANLPNTPGFEFIGIMNDGTEALCIVLLNPVGCCGVYHKYTNDPCWFKLKTWRHKAEVE